MVGLILCIICGHVVLLLLLLLLGDGTGAAAVTRSDLAATRAALDALRREFAPRQVAESIFAPADYLFVARAAPLPVRRLFLTERHALALRWLRDARRHAARLTRFHREEVRSRLGLRPAAELKLAAYRLRFHLLHAALFALVWSCGPSPSRSTARFAAGLLEQLGGLHDHLAGSLEHPHAARFKTGLR